MSTRRRQTIALLGAVAVIAACGFAAGPAVAASAANPVIHDCLAHPGGMTGSYTVQQLRHALQVMPAETKEYTSCPDVINRALLSTIGGEHGRHAAGTTSGGGSGSVLPTPVIIILVVLGLAAVTLAAVAVRRRRSPGG
ncbi:MAG: hypothetical protein ACR2MK_08090 [Solirubrobacteraceae bacterium]